MLPLLAAGLLFLLALAVGPRLLRRWLKRPTPEPRGPVPAHWADFLAGRVPLAAGLGAEDRIRLMNRMKAMLERVHFEGVGVEMTEEIRLTVAAQACLIGLQLPPDCFDHVTSVLLYPSSFVPREFSWVRGGVPHRPPEPMLGESWDRGTVILAVDGVLAGARDPADGANLVVHEFAHQLDQVGGSVDGVPELPDPGESAVWNQVMQAALDRLERDLAGGLPSLLDPYAATNPAEFFAVASETFFERPAELSAGEPELYRELVRFYRQDPESRRKPPWRGGAPTP